MLRSWGNNKRMWVSFGGIYSLEFKILTSFYVNNIQAQRSGSNGMKVTRSLLASVGKEKCIQEDWTGVLEVFGA